jgi:hypothetical protein
MQILIKIDTLSELNSLLGRNLKRAGHSRYCETTKKLFGLFSKNYKTEFSQESLMQLKTYHQDVNPLLHNIHRNAKHDQIKEYALRLKSEIERLIHIQEKNQI